MGLFATVVATAILPHNQWHVGPTQLLALGSIGVELVVLICIGFSILLTRLTQDVVSCYATTLLHANCSSCWQTTEVNDHIPHAVRAYGHIFLMPAGHGMVTKRIKSSDWTQLATTTSHKSAAGSGIYKPPI